MAQPGNFTPILLYGSSTPTNVPLAANLTNSATGSEIAINVADKNLFFKDSGGVVNTVPIRQSSTSSNGWLSSTDWNTFNSKAPATSGTSILYGNGAGGFSNVTIGTGISFAGGTLSATGSGGTVTSVAALTLGTTGTDLSSTVANGTTTPVITLNVPTASAANRGALSAADWSTFNGKQAALVSGTNIKTVGGVTLLGSGDVGTIGVGYGGTGTSTAFTAGSVVFAGASGVYSQSNANFFWDNTNKRLGLNTTTPGYQLNTYASVDVLSIQQVAQVNTAGSGTAAIGFNVSFVAGEGSNTKGGIGFQRNAAYGGGFMAFYNNNSGAAGDFTTADEAMRIHNSKGVSIGNTTDPGVGNLRLSGFLETVTNGSTALANALNSDLVITTNSGFMTFTGGGASCQLGGMVAGLDGQRVVILNTTGSTITIIGESGSSTAANRIWTPGLASVGWNNLGSREFIYSGSQSRWLMIGASAS